MIKSIKIAAARFRTPRGVCPSIHLSIHPFIRLLCPSKPNAKDDASSSGGPAVSRGLSFATHAVPRSFVRSLARSLATIVVAKRAPRDPRLLMINSISVVSREQLREYTRNRWSTTIEPYGRDISAGIVNETAISVLSFYPVESLSVSYAAHKFQICPSRDVRSNFLSWRTWISLL